MSAQSLAKNMIQILAVCGCNLLAVSAGICAELKNLSDDPSVLAKAKQLTLGFQKANDADFVGILQKALSFDGNSALRLEKTTSLPNGRKILRFEQTYQGVPIWGERVIATRDQDGTLQSLAGKATYNFGAAFSAAGPKLSQDQALSKAVEAAKTLPAGAGLSDVTDSLVREIIHVDASGMAASAYEVSFIAKTTSRPERQMRPFVILDSRTGQTLRSWDGLANFDATGPGGNQKTGRIVYGKAKLPPLHVTRQGKTCALRVDDVWTEDMGGRIDGGGTPYMFDCPESKGREINGGFAAVNDAHVFGSITTEMYKTWYNISPLKSPVHLRVHFGTKLEQAFWGGKQVTFGDGSDDLYPLVSLDIVSHEIAHGFTEQNAGLIYAGQSGAVNEAFSDMAGMAAAAFARERYGFRSPDLDYSIGSTITKGASRAVRYMCQPKKDGRSIENARDYVDGMDVHHASGVFNRAFCLLSKAPNWTIRKAFDVFVLANQNFWRPDSTFTTAARGVLDAAQALGYELPAITAAFNEVGVETESRVAAAPPAKPVPMAICSFLGDALPNNYITAASSQIATDMIQKIVDASGLAPNFEVAAAPIPNAAAVTDGSVRRVLYNPQFIDGLSALTGSRWAPLSVLAHEIGHHLNGHTLAQSGSQPNLELEADTFSGFILQRLGASLEEARVVMNTLGGDTASPTHPAKIERLKAISIGWVKACKKDPDCLLDEDSAKADGPPLDTEADTTGQNPAWAPPTSSQNEQRPPNKKALLH